MIFGEEQLLVHLERLQGRFGTTAPWGGFYTFGEIATVGGMQGVHNYTAALLALS
jgi:small ligand-binding sensory domain FIST